eukprot:16705-Chlamydomonas_euryale.AAC.3
MLPLKPLSHSSTPHQGGESLASKAAPCPQAPGIEGGRGIKRWDETGWVPCRLAGLQWYVVTHVRSERPPDGRWVRGTGRGPMEDTPGLSAARQRGANSRGPSEENGLNATLV